MGGGVEKYRVGDIIISTNNEDPSVKYGGTWQLLAPGRTLVCVNTGDSALNAAKKIGGSINPLTAHAHTDTTYIVPFANYTGGIDRRTTYGMPSGYQYYTYSTSTVGDNTNHNNWQPFMVVYMWERVA